MLQDFIQANQDVRQHSSHLAMQELLASGPAALAGEMTAPSGEPVDFWSKFEVELISSEEEEGDLRPLVPPSKHRASTEPAATPDSSSGAASSSSWQRGSGSSGGLVLEANAKSAKSSQEPAAGSRDLLQHSLPTRDPMLPSDKLQLIFTEVKIMQEEFAKGCDAKECRQIVERITELSTELDNMNLHDMPELRDFRRGLLHDMDYFCTKASLTAMSAEKATSAKATSAHPPWIKREGQKHDQPRPKAAKLEEKPDSSRSTKAPFGKGSSVNVKRKTRVKVKTEMPVESKSKKAVVAKKPARAVEPNSSDGKAESEQSDATVCYIDAPGNVYDAKAEGTNDAKAAPRSAATKAAQRRAKRRAEGGEWDSEESLVLHDSDHMSVEEDAEPEGADEAKAEAEGIDDAEPEGADEAKAEIDATIAEITQRAFTDEWYGKTEVLDVLAKLPRDALPDPAHKHGAKNYTRDMGSASITVRFGQQCFYVKPVPEERVSDKVMQDNKLRRDAGKGVNVSFNKFGHTAAWHVAKVLALRHQSEKDHVIVY